MLHQLPTRARLGFAAALLVSTSAPLWSQTSGSLNSQVTSPWSTAPWLGGVPNAGGVATFLEQVNTVLGTVPAVPTISLDIPVTLSGLTFNNVFQYNLTAGAGSLTLGDGAIINLINNNQSSPTLFTAGNVITVPVAGGGPNGLVVNGPGTVTVAGAGTFTGGVRISGGATYRITTGDTGLGAAGAGNDVTLNNGLLRVSTAALTTARNFTLGAGGGTFQLFANATVNGIVSGGGNLSHTVGSTLFLSGANTYTGTTTQTAGTLTMNGANGTIATSTGYDIAGIVTLDNATANNNNRLSDSVAITSRGATFNLTGNAAAATSESAGVLNLVSGNTTITVTPNAAQQASYNFAGVNRQNNSTLFVRGTNLGATPANGVAQIGSTASPGALVGGGGAPGSTNISVLPWAVGNVGAAATVGSSLVTYAGGNFRPLANAEYAAAIGGSATDNVRLTAATVAPAGTVNALVFAPAAAATLSGGTIAITSGAFLYSPTATATGTVSAGLDFGAAEGVIHTSNTLGLSGVMQGSNGVTYNAYAGSAVTLSGASTYTGTTRINAGQLSFAGTIDAMTAGPLGQTSAPIVLNVGSLTTRIWVNGDTTINRDISVQGNPSNSFTAGLGSTANFNITLNGNLDLQRRVLIENGALPFTINGIVSGPGSLSDAFASLVVLNGNNTYSGGTEITTGTYQLGSDTGFGTGAVFFSGLGFVRGAGTTARTIGNAFLYNTATATFSGTAPLNLTGSQNLNGPRTLAITNTAGTTLSGLVSDGSLTKTGVGTLSLNNPTGNTYTGGTVLGAAAGTINVNNLSGSGTGSGTVSIGASSTLAGSFSISGATSIAGLLSPGNGGAGAIGTATFVGSLTLSSATTSSILLEIAGNGNNDRINVGGSLTLAGTVVLATIGGYTVQAGDTFDFVDWGTLAGSVTFDTTGVTLAPGVTFDTTNFLTNGTLTAVPEPGVFALLGVAGAALVAFRRRRSA